MITMRSITIPLHGSNLPGFWKAASFLPNVEVGLLMSILSRCGVEGVSNGVPGRLADSDPGVVGEVKLVVDVGDGTMGLISTELADNDVKVRAGL